MQPRLASTEKMKREDYMPVYHRLSHAGQRYGKLHMHIEQTQTEQSRNK